MTYQWQRSKDEGKTWTDISGETSETLNVTIQSSDFGSQYRCIAKDFMGHVATSQAGKLASSIASQSAWDPEYTIINEPDDYYGRPGDIATFIVEAEGKNLSYQWLYQAPGSDEFVYCTSSDATTNTLRVEMTAESDGAQYRCFITDANGDMGSTRCATVKLDVRDWTVEYEAGGLRTKRSSAEKTYNYIYSGDKLVRMTCGDNILDFTYDANGAPLTLVTGGKVYYYLTNLQGDVMSIESSDGTPVASYCYDAWGKILACDGALAELNPLRYRGYVYDQETGFYYVSSRYFDPEVGRFINADDVNLLGANGDLVSLNLFAYCGNNPVSREDANGGFWLTVGVMAVGGLIGAAISAVSSVVTQQALTGTVNWKSVGVATAAGFVSGAVAASPLGLVGQQVAGGVIGGLSYAADCYVNDKAMKLDEAVLSVGMGVISGRIGGSGANEKMALSNAAKSAKQTIVRETRRANQKYAQKVIAAAICSRNNAFATTAWVASFRFAAGTGVSNGVNGKYSSWGLFPDAPTWKPW